MWSPLGIFLVAALALESTKAVCHNQEDIYYKELGCHSEGTDKDGCVTSYDCSSISQRSMEQCHYKGQAYVRGQLLEKSPTCLADCQCSQSSGGIDKHIFTCADVECPEFFEGPLKAGCYYVYQHDKCCPFEHICEDVAASKSPRASCEYAGVTYKEGQKFYPEEHPCMTCICESGFNGTLIEPFCRKFECDLELHYGDHIAEGCVPVYYGTKGCCPIDWKCPEKTDSVIPVNNKNESGSSPAPGKTCKFGKLIMQIGDMLSTKNSNTKCACRVPPHPLCFQDETP